MRSLTIFSIVAMLGLLASPTLAQPHPQYQFDNYSEFSGSAYDPFRFNWSIGRYYAPAAMRGTNQRPYQFNWYSGRWEYFPWRPPLSPAQIQARGKARPVHQVPNYELSLSRQINASAQPAAAIIAPTQTTRGLTVSIHKNPPTTARSQSLAATQPSQQGPMALPKDPLNIPATVGRWEYDTNTGHWVHVLPPDNGSGR